MNGQASRLIQLNKLAERKSTSSGAKIVSICSGKGGTGKTFFSANFAYELSKLGHKILLIDLDLNFSNLNVMLNQASLLGISSFFEQKKTLEEIIVNYTPNLDLVFGDSGKSGYPRVSKEILDYFFSSLSKFRNKYDFILLDSSAGAGELLLHQFKKSDYNLIVASPEPTAILDAYVVVKMLIEEASEADRIIVINKCSDPEEGITAFANLSTAAKHFLKETLVLLGNISFDRSVHKSIVNQELVSKFDQESPVLPELHKIISKFLTIAQLANNNQPR